MARLHHHLSLVPILLLLPVLRAAASAAAVEHDISISVQYPTEEEARWLDRWSEKYQAQGGSGFSVHPATDEESAYINSIFDNGKKRAASGDHSHDGGGARAGFDGHIEFGDDDHPFGRIVVDTVHSRASSSEPKDDDLQNHESHSHAEDDDVKDL